MSALSRTAARTDKKVLMRLALWVVVGLLCGASGIAQAGTALSGVHVRITFTAPLQPAPATVRLESSNGIGAVRTSTAAPEPSAWFSGLPEAEYILSTLVAGLPAIVGPVTVGAGEIVSVEVIVPATGQAVVAVRSRWRSQEGARFAGALLEDLPSASDLWSLIETAAPFVIVDRMDTGGLGTARSALAGSRGESWGTTSIAEGDATVRFPTATGQLPLLGNMPAAASVIVASGLAPVEVATPGVHVLVSPKRPGTKPSFGGHMSFTTPGMVGTNAIAGAPSIARVDRSTQGGLYGGGPLTASTGLFVAVDAANVQYTERGTARVNDARSRTAFVHLVRRAGDANEVRLQVAVDRGQAPYEGRRQFADTAVSSTTTFGRMQLTWDRVNARGTRRSLSVGAQTARVQPDVAAGWAGGVVDRVLDGVVPVPPSADRRNQWNLTAEINGSPVRLGSTEHALRFGLSAERIRESSSIVTLPVVGESVSGLPARVWEPQVPDVPSNRGLTDAAFYLADRIAFGNTFVLDAGVRAETMYGSARGAERGLRWGTIVPRLAFRWQPSVFTVFGGVGEYVAANPLTLLTYGDPGTVAFDVHRWNDVNGNGAVDSGEAGILVARRGRNRTIASIDGGLEPPISREWSVGAEFRPTPRSTLAGVLTIRRTRNLVGSVNDGVPFSSYRLFTVPDIGEDEGQPADDQELPIFERRPETFGDDRYRLTNPPGAKATYGGIEITWTIEGARWNMLFGATAYRTRGWGGDLGFGPLENDQLVIGDHYENPNMSDNVPGSFIFDRSYVGKWSGSYRAPGDVRAAFAVRYQDGQPFTRYVIAPDLAGGPEVVHAYRMGRTRFTYTATVDARLEKGITVGRRRAAIRLDIFNLTNHANEVEEDVVSGPSFRRSTAVQPPVTLRLGFSVQF
jgi:hypothetical protein